MKAEPVPPVGSSFILPPSTTPSLTVWLLPGAARAVPGRRTLLPFSFFLFNAYQLELFASPEIPDETIITRRPRGICCRLDSLGTCVC